MESSESFLQGARRMPQQTRRLGESSLKSISSHAAVSAPWLYDSDVCLHQTDDGPFVTSAAGGTLP